MKIEPGKRYEVRVIPTWRLNYTQREWLDLMLRLSTCHVLYSTKREAQPWLASELLARSGVGSKPTPTQKTRATGAQ